MYFLTPLLQYKAVLSFSLCHLLERGNLSEEVFYWLSRASEHLGAWSQISQAPSAAARAPIASRFACEAVDAGAGHVHDESCGHFHMPDPSKLGDNFSWRDAVLTVITAGSRPCSGAILVLVFALAQGLMYAGIAATFAMALGTAITTGALASLAVLAKSLALRLTGAGSRRGELIARGLEFAAACLVLTLGLALFFGYALAGF